MKQGQMDTVLKSSSHPTVFQELISGSLPDSEKETRRLQDEAQLVVAAGVTTTGWALTTGTFHLLNNPSTLAKLRNELVSALPDPGAPLSWTELEKLPYLTGCVREAVRLSHAVTARNPRLFNKPLEYEGWVIPPRTPVSMTNVDVEDSAPGSATLNRVVDATRRLGEFSALTASSRGLPVSLGSRFARLPASVA